VTLRVVQWTTGNVGRRSVIAIAQNRELELVGCYAWSPEKVGRDVGELCGIEPLGVKATHDVDALLALRPDCVVYNPMWPSIDELVRILEAGVNVSPRRRSSTAGGSGRIASGSSTRASGAARRCSARVSIPGSPSCWASWSPACAIGSTRSRAARRPRSRVTHSLPS